MLKDSALASALKGVDAPFQSPVQSVGHLFAFLIFNFLLFPDWGCGDETHRGHKAAGLYAFHWSVVLVSKLVTLSGCGGGHQNCEKAVLLSSGRVTKKTRIQ